LINIGLELASERDGAKPFQTPPQVAARPVCRDL
jgi:hypothetical protein